MTETLPVLGADQNAAGGTGTIITDFDSWGRVSDVVDADGYMTQYAYDDATGAVTQTIASLGNGQTITTSSQVNALGRPTQETDGDGQTTTIQYVDGLYDSTVTTTPPGDAPEQVVDNQCGLGIVVTGASQPDGSLAVNSRTWLDYAGRTIATAEYDGYNDTYTIQTEYDYMGRPYWTEDADGTITETMYDGLGRVASTYEGTSDDNLTLVQTNVYDAGGVGDGNLTSQTDGDGHTTLMGYDWEDRLVAQSNGRQTTVNTLDTLGDVVQTDTYNARLPGGNFSICNGA